MEEVLIMREKYSVKGDRWKASDFNISKVSPGDGFDKTQSSVFVWRFSPR